MHKTHTHTQSEQQQPFLPPIVLLEIILSKLIFDTHTRLAFASAMQFDAPNADTKTNKHEFYATRIYVYASWMKMQLEVCKPK